MKEENYRCALDCYTQAIDLDLRNAVYYCNRYFGVWFLHLCSIGLQVVIFWWDKTSLQGCSSQQTGELHWSHKRLWKSHRHRPHLQQSVRQDGVSVSPANRNEWRKIASWSEGFLGFLFCSLALTAMNKYPEAISYFKKALVLDPDNDTYKSNLKIAEQKQREASSPVSSNPLFCLPPSTLSITCL